MEIQLSQIIFQIINFSIIVLVLFKLLYKPILKVLEQRSLKIEDGLKAAEKNLKAQEEMDDKVKNEMANARKQAEQITAEAKKTAQKEAAEILNQAKIEAKKLAAKEQQAMIASLETERRKLESSFVDLVSDTVRQLLHDYLKPEQQQAIIDQQIKHLKNIKLSK